MEHEPDGTKAVVAGMYILEPGTTLADAPDIAGSLTPWHNHTNLCWDGNRLTGLLVAGTCTPGGVVRVTPPMIHVWLQDQKGGPFSGLENVEPTVDKIIPIP
jgi:hypothetical protein